MFYNMVFLRYLLPGLVASIVFLGISEIHLQRKGEQITWSHRIMLLLMGWYLTVIFAVTVSPDYVFSMKQFGQNINIIPFQALHTAFSSPLNFWGNIIMFMPFGTFLVLLSNKYQKLSLTLLTGAGLSLFIELLQLFSIRSTDIDDILLNVTGTFCGFIIGKGILLSMPSLRKTTGVFKRMDDKLYRNHQDGGRIVVFIILIFTSVFSTGFSGLYGAPFLPKEQKLAVSEPSSPVDSSEQIFVDIDAKNAYLLNIDANTVLYKKESSQQIAPASTAKMLTALTVMEYCDKDERVLVGKEVRLIAEDASRAWLTPGSELTVQQLLNALLLPSGNDAAYALAVFAGRKACGDDEASIEDALGAFVKAMNEKAAEVGAADSNFSNPDGYDADGQYTTAYDLACIAKAFWKSSVLRDISSSYRISDTWLSGQKITHNNSNQLINPDSPYYYEYATGLKTGKSVAAGCCLVSAAYIEDALYICVVMGSTEEGRWIDSLALYDAIGSE